MANSITLSISESVTVTTTTGNNTHFSASANQTFSNLQYCEKTLRKVDDADGFVKLYAAAASATGTHYTDTVYDVDHVSYVRISNLSSTYEVILKIETDESASAGLYYYRMIPNGFFNLSSSTGHLDQYGRADSCGGDIINVYARAIGGDADIECIVGLEDGY